MINKHQSIALFGKPLFSLMDFNTPINEKLPIPAVACFCYILDSDNQSIDQNAGITAKRGNVILSLCGVTLGNILSHQEAGKIKTLVIHFFPEHLKTAFSDTKPPHWKELDTPISKYVVQMAANNLIKNYVNSIQTLFNNKEAVTEELLVLKLKELLILMLQTESSPEILKIVRSLFSEREFSFKEIIDAHLFESMSINDLASLTNLSLSTFKRTFKKTYNDSPNNYIIRKRTEEVAKILMISDLPVAHIGYDCGFSSPAHLNRCFKEKYGVPPSKYRMSLSGKK